tara:strand:+ start:142 stop:528 length:387 start_codon:yes stop_codon:yes gene_type:complete
MRVVKTLVAFMGLLIVIGIGLVAYGLSLDKNAKDQDAALNEQAPSVPMAGDNQVVNAPDAISAGSKIAPFGDITVDIEPDERLIGYTVSGDNVTLHIEGGDGLAAHLVIVSLSEKTVLGRILIAPNAQ